MSNKVVPANIWGLTMGDMPMPEGTTFDQMNAMYEVVRRLENRDFAVEQIKWYEKRWRENLPKYKDAKAHKDENPERFEIMNDIMKMLKEGIVMYRGWLAE